MHIYVYIHIFIYIYIYIYIYTIVTYINDIQFYFIFLMKSLIKLQI